MFVAAPESEVATAELQDELAEAWAQWGIGMCGAVWWHERHDERVDRRLRADGCRQSDPPDR